MITFETAVQLVQTAVGSLESEQVMLDQAHGRVLGAPVVAQVASPPTNLAAMDGYAVREADVINFPTKLKLIGQSYPARGHDGEVHPGTAVRIFTGAPIPLGAGRVVVQENVCREGGRS